MGGAILLPYANRIRGAISADGRSISTQIAGRNVNLPANAGGKRAGAEQYAMHGLILASRFRDLQERTTAEEDRVRGVLSAGTFDNRWPSETQVSITYSLTRKVFRLDVTANNVGGDRLPLGIGWHPERRSL